MLIWCESVHISRHLNASFHLTYFVVVLFLVLVFGWHVERATFYSPWEFRHIRSHVENGMYENANVKIQTIRILIICRFKCKGIFGCCSPMQSCVTQLHVCLRRRKPFPHIVVISFWLLFIPFMFVVGVCYFFFSRWLFCKIVNYNLHVH